MPERVGGELAELAALDRVILAITVERLSAATHMSVIRCPRYEGLR